MTDTAPRPDADGPGTTAIGGATALDTTRAGGRSASSGVADVGEHEPSIGRLVADASRDVSLLVQNEIALAKAEVKVSVKAGGLGIGLLAGAAFIAVLGVIMLSFTIVYFINWAGLGLHWSYLIVTGFWFLVVALMGWIGVKKLKQVGPPEKAIEQGKEIPKALRGKS